MAGVSKLNPSGIKNGNGKRERVDLEDDQEFMPLSKRINNIHLSPERLLHNQSQHSSISGINGNAEAGPSSSMVHSHSHPGLNYPTYPYQNSAPMGHNNLTDGSVPPHISYEQQALEFQQKQNRNHHHHHHALPLEMERSRSDYEARSIPKSSTDTQTSVANYQNPDTVSHNVPVDDPSGRNSFTNPEYRPSLDQNDNPHYYEANRTLFDLYLERLARQNQSPHPNVFVRTSDLN